MDKKNFYITTPIYYVNDVPHIGHACTTIVADVIARQKRLEGKNVFFLTGTDEHGAKVAQAAEKNNLKPIEFCNQISKRFKQTWKKLNISNDYFFRTTNPDHAKVVSEVLRKIYQKGDIYKSTYEGLYCIGCEKFLTESDLVDGKCPLHPPQQTVKQQEENWFFKITKYVPQIYKLIENEQTNYVVPEGKRKEILAKLKTIDRDISISRANVSWGIPVPWDKSQTIYVWIEALLNYYTATKFIKGKNQFWPADIHLLGKEILLFHAVIWQAILLSAELVLPKKTIIHDFYITGERKISKSLGNMISPDELLEKFGLDATRYLITASFPIGGDTSIDIDKLRKKYNADLANGLGNLVSRVAVLAEKNNFSCPNITLKKDKAVSNLINLANTPEALFIIWNKGENSVSEVNKKFNEQKAWKQKGKLLEKVLTDSITSIMNIAKNVEPFMPGTSKQIRGIFEPKKLVKAPKKPLFPRIL
jgi:methionyl-tRNA synthetase